MVSDTMSSRKEDRAAPVKLLKLLRDSHRCRYSRDRLAHSRGDPSPSARHHAPSSFCVPRVTQENSSSLRATKMRKPIMVIRIWKALGPAAWEADCHIPNHSPATATNPPDASRTTSSDR